MRSQIWSLEYKIGTSFGKIYFINVMVSHYDTGQGCLLFYIHICVYLIMYNFFTFMKHVSSSIVL